VIEPPLEQPGDLRKLALNLFHGYGYTFYKLENELRQDDQRVRQLACSLLQRARGALGEAENAYRREMIPPPSRAQPFPDPALVAGAKRLEALALAVSALEAQVRAQPVPGNDLMTRRYHNEAARLAELSERDLLLVEDAQGLCNAVEGQGHAALLPEAAAIDARIAALRQRLTDRGTLLI
jgi:hypothetical protein